MENRDFLDQKGLVASKVLKGQKVIRVILAHKASKDSRVFREFVVKRESLAKKAKKAKKAIPVKAVVAAQLLMS